MVRKMFGLQNPDPYRNFCTDPDPSIKRKENPKSNDYYLQFVTSTNNLLVVTCEDWCRCNKKKNFFKKTYFCLTSQKPLKKRARARAGASFSRRRFFRLCSLQCCRSMTFWCGSGSCGSSGFMPMTNGSGSCYFHHWPSRRQQFLKQFFCIEGTFISFFKEKNQKEVTKQ